MSILTNADFDLIMPILPDISTAIPDKAFVTP
jgi:hypothetical protein